MKTEYRSLLAAFSLLTFSGADKPALATAPDPLTDPNAFHVLAKENLPEHPEAEALFAQGMILFEAEEFREAAQAFRQSAELATNSTAARKKAMLSHFLCEEFEQAAEIASGLLEDRAEHSIETFRLLAFSYYQLGQIDDSFKTLTSAIEKYPFVDVFFTDLGRLTLQTGSMVEGLQWTHQAVSLNEQKGENWEILGSLYHGAGYDGAAALCYARALLARNPAEGSALEGLRKVFTPSRHNPLPLPLSRGEHEGALLVLDTFLRSAQKEMKGDPSQDDEVLAKAMSSFLSQVEETPFTEKNLSRALFRATKFLTKDYGDDMRDMIALKLLEYSEHGTYQEFAEKNPVLARKFDYLLYFAQFESSAGFLPDDK